jgi:hypothetical protein
MLAWSEAWGAVKDRFFSCMLLLSTMVSYAAASLQSFSIPGTIFLNIIAGALFDLSGALPLVCLVRCKQFMVSCSPI